MAKNDKLKKEAARKKAKSRQLRADEDEGKFYKTRVVRAQGRR
jgi:hypothetical protein